MRTAVKEATAPDPYSQPTVLPSRHTFPTSCWAVLLHCPAPQTPSVREHIPLLSSYYWLPYLHFLTFLGVVSSPITEASLSGIPYALGPQERSILCLPHVSHSGSSFPLFLPLLQPCWSSGPWTTSFHLKWAQTPGSRTLQPDPPS